MLYIADLTSDLIAVVPEGRLRLSVACVMLVWVCAIVSAFIDNIPFTTTMVYHNPFIVQWNPTCSCSFALVTTDPHCGEAVRVEPWPSTPAYHLVTRPGCLPRGQWHANWWYVLITQT